MDALAGVEVSDDDVAARGLGNSSIFNDPPLDVDSDFVVEFRVVNGGADHVREVFANAVVIATGRRVHDETPVEYFVAAADGVFERFPLCNGQHAAQSGWGQGLHGSHRRSAADFEEGRRAQELRHGYFAAATTAISISHSGRASAGTGMSVLAARCPPRMRSRTAITSVIGWPTTT